MKIPHNLTSKLCLGSSITNFKYQFSTCSRAVLPLNFNFNDHKRGLHSSPPFHRFWESSPRGEYRDRNKFDAEHETVM